MDWKAEAEQIWDQYEGAKKCCGERCSNFAGALFAEILRGHLLAYGVPVSCRNVFIRGLNLEVDLLVQTKEAVPDYGILYQQSDVLGVLEVKAFGAMGKESVCVVKENLERIGQLTGAKGRIQSFYVCLQENGEREFTGQDVPFGDYSLFLNMAKPTRRCDTGDWQKLVSDLRTLT